MSPPIIRPIHGSVHVGFVPNSEPTWPDRVFEISTSHRLEWLIGSGWSDLQRMAVDSVRDWDWKIGQNISDWKIGSRFGEISVIFSPEYHRKFTKFGEISLDSTRSPQIQWDLAKSGGDFKDLAEILQEMDEISPDLQNFTELSRIGWVSSGLGEKIGQPTRRLRVLEVETRRRPSSASSQMVLRLDRTIFAGGSGIDFPWTALLFMYEAFDDYWELFISRVSLCLGLNNTCYGIRCFL